MRPGIVRYLIVHSLEIQRKQYFHVFAVVNWLKPSKQDFGFKNPLSVWHARGYEISGPSVFLPVQRIHSKYLSAEKLLLGQKNVSFGPTGPNHPNVSFGSQGSFHTTVSFEPSESNDTTCSNNRTVSVGLNNWNKSHRLIYSNSLTHSSVSFGLTSSHHRNVTFGPTGSNHTTVVWPNQIK